MQIFSRSILFGGAALALIAAMPAQAQDRTTYTRIVDGAPERVEVIMPHTERSEIGAPIEYRSISRDVRFDDLDLSTRAGAHELRERVRQTARDMCNQPDMRFAVPTASSPPCYSTAVRDAMEQVDSAIVQAHRG